VWREANAACARIAGDAQHLERAAAVLDVRHDRVDALRLHEGPKPVDRRLQLARSNEHTEFVRSGPDPPSAACECACSDTGHSNQ